MKRLLGILLTLVSMSCGAKGFPSEEMCEATTIFKEANTESLEGQRAVLSVLRNRMRIHHMTACKVVAQKGQWSWFRATPGKPYNWSLSIKALQTYELVRIMPDMVGPDVYYFRVGKRKVKWYGKYCCKIGHHLFYYKD